MRYFIAAAAILFCINATAYHRPDVPQSKMKSDYMACHIQGLKAAPADRVGGADRNFPLRMAVTESCMNERGYKTVKAPFCSFKKIPDMSQPHQLTKKSCLTGKDFWYAFTYR